jgi:tetratricopeptide (TPR) repeat protein
VLRRLLESDDDRWSPLAGCQLWLLYLETDRRPQAYAVFDLISAKYSPRQLAEALPDDMRRTLLGIYVNDFSGFNLLRRPDPLHVERLRQASALRELLDPDIARFYLVRAYESAGDLAAAERVSDQMIAEGINLYGWYALRTLEAHATLKCVRGRPREALDRIHEVLLDADGDARPQFWALMVDRARVLDAMGDFEQAEKDLDAFIAYRQDRQSYAPMAAASLMLGFLRAERGDAAAARQAWRAGRYSEHVAQLPSRAAEPQRDAVRGLGTQEVLAALALGCLSDDITDEQIEQFLDGLMDSGTMGGNFEAFRRGMFRIPPRVVRAIFADARGREWARRFGFRADPPPQQLRHFVALFLGAFLANGIAPAGDAEALTSEQRAMAARAGEGMQQMYEHNRVQAPHMLQLALAWKGTSGPMGWDGLYAALDADLRGPLGMVMADRFERGGDAATAAAVRRRAADDLKRGSATPPTTAATAPATAPARRVNVHVDVPLVRPPGERSPTRPRVAASAPSKSTGDVANASPPPTPRPAPQAPQSPAPAGAADAALYEELRQQNAQAYRLRRDGKLTEAADLRRGVVERAKAAWPAGDERVISFTVDDLEVLLELQRYDEADALVRVAPANVAASGPAAERVKSVAGRLQRARGKPSPAMAVASAKTVPSATRPVTQTPTPTIASSAHPAPAAAPASSLDAELKFVADAINAREYRDAEGRLLEMYVAALSGDAEPARRRAILLGLARVYDAWGKPADAKVFRDRAAAAVAPVIQPTAGQPDPQKLEWIDAMNRQAFSLRQQNRLNLAETLRSRVVSEVKSILPPGDKRVIGYQIDYVDLLIQMQKYEEAERQLLEADRAITDRSNPPAATIHRALIRTYEA